MCATLKFENSTIQTGLRRPYNYPLYYNSTKYYVVYTNNITALREHKYIHKSMVPIIVYQKETVYTPNSSLNI